VASKRQHPTLTLNVCLNCHRLLSQRQYRWPPGWKTEKHPLRCVAQGVYDVLCLWRERSPLANEALALLRQCRELLTMLGQAALYTLAWMRPEAWVEFSALVDWGVR
jgi:hypothetical protein